MLGPEREKSITDFFHGHQAVPKFNSIGIIWKGPKNNRTSTNMCFVEFFTPDDAAAALKELKNKKLEFGSTSILIKGALTKVNGSRNWSLRAAEKVLQGVPDIKKDGLKIDWKTRNVEYGGAIAFDQQPNDLKGSFVEPFTHLILP